VRAERAIDETRARARRSESDDCTRASARIARAPMKRFFLLRSQQLLLVGVVTLSRRRDRGRLLPFVDDDDNWRRAGLPGNRTAEMKTSGQSE